MDYAFKVTTNGRAALAACMAKEASPVITRVAVGSGQVEEGANLADQHELVEYVAEGAAGDRRHEQDLFYFTVQYSNQFSPGIDTFYLSEFIVYIRDPDTGEDTDLLYGTLGSYKIAVPSFSASSMPSVFNLPLVIALSDELIVTIAAAPGLVTYKDLETAVKRAVSDAVDESGWRGAEFITCRVSLAVDGWIYDETDKDYPWYYDIRTVRARLDMMPALAVHPQSRSIAFNAGMCGTVQSFAGYVRVWAQKQPTAIIYATLALMGESVGSCSCVIATLTLTADGWKPDADGEYNYVQDVELAESKETLFPVAAPHKEDMLVALLAGLSPTAESLNGAVRFRAREEPKGDIGVSLALHARTGSGITLEDGEGTVYLLADGTALGTEE